MKFLIEAGGRFTGPKASKPVGAYLDEVGRTPMERDITGVLRSAALGAVGMSALKPKQGQAIEDAIDSRPTMHLQRIAPEITGIVRFAFSERYTEFLTARRAALGVSVAAQTASKVQIAEHEQLVYYLDRSTYPAPIHVSNRGFVQEVGGSQRLDYTDLSFDPPFTDLEPKQRLFAISNNYLQVGKYVPMRLSELHEPIVTGGPVPTVGTLEAGEYVPKVVMHTEAAADWQPVTW